MIDTLEARRLYSASVHSLGGQGLFVQGGNGDDVIAIDQEGTTVTVTDGQTNPTTNTYTNVKYLVVHLGNGNNTLSFTGADSAAVILAGNGDDHLEINTLGTESVIVDGGAGANDLEIFSMGSSCVIAKTGPGQDDGDVTVLDSASVTYDAGAGDDTIHLTNIGTTAKITYYGGSGNDDVFLFVNTSGANNVVIAGGSGSDTFNGDPNGAILISMENINP